MQSDASAKGWYHSHASVALVPLHLFFFFITRGETQTALHTEMPRFCLSPFLFSLTLKETLGS